MDVLEWPSGQVTTDVLPPTPRPAVESRYVADLSAFVGKIITLRLKNIPGVNSSSIAMDNVLVRDYPVESGQAPQPGLAVFDINGATNLGGDTVSFGGPGPFYGQSMPGLPLAFSFEGEGVQPILVMYGAMNQGAATFPQIGQMDIGGAPDPVSGIPVGTAFLFNGTDPTGLNPLFWTTPQGTNLVQFTTPALPPGIVTTFQAAIFNSTSGIALSNAVQLEIQ